MGYIYLKKKNGDKMYLLKCVFSHFYSCKSQVEISMSFLDLSVSSYDTVMIELKMFCYFA